MPIRIPSDLPARATLEKEGVMVMGEDSAIQQDIRPLRIGLLNLMPNKVRTETQIARLIGSSPLQVELTLVKMTGHKPKTASADHMIAFYQNFQDIKAQKFDGFVITGAPIELLDFTEVKYWSELEEVFDWTQSHVHSNFNICWGAQAALYHFYGVPKYALPQKAFGVFRHKNLNPASTFLRGFSDDFSIPVSRWTEIRRADLPQDKQLEVLMESDEVGPCLISDPQHRSLHMFNHLEYDSTDLAEEYHRDQAAKKQISLPSNYFPNNDPTAKPENRWRSHAHLLFGNWINDVYQTTPYELNLIGETK